MPSLDLVALWEAHCRYEFDTRDVDATMSTMVAEPYVNHIPNMTGGVGFESLRHFYAHHIPRHPGACRVAYRRVRGPRRLHRWDRRAHRGACERVGRAERGARVEHRCATW